MKNTMIKTRIFTAIIAIILCCAAIYMIGTKPQPTIAQAADGDTCGDHTGYTQLTSDGGEIGVADGTAFYYLTENTILANNITVVGNVTLCLNGYVLCGNGSGSVITVSSGAVFTLIDCKSDSAAPEHKHYYIKDAASKLRTFTDNGAFLSESDGRDYVIGGVITGGRNATGYGGGVITGGRNATGYGGGVYNNGTFAMNGGSICGNAAQNGGGVYNGVDGSFDMTNGIIAGNTAKNGGGVYADYYCTLRENAVIAENTADNGGGVYSNSPLFSMTGGSINDNSAKLGGGVYINDSFSISHGYIRNNTANDNGGGVYSNNSLDLTNGVIRDNVCNADGLTAAGVYVPPVNGMVFLHGAPIVTDNYYSSGEKKEQRNLFLGEDIIITLVSPLYDGANVGVYAQLPSGASERVITRGYGNFGNGSPADAYFSTDNGLKPIVNSGGEIAVTDIFDLTLNLYKDKSGEYVTDAELTAYKAGEGSIALPSPTRSGYTFGGWYENADFTGSPITEITSERMGDITLYAKWTIPHTWGEPTWVWSRDGDGVQAQATFTCGECGETHTETNSGNKITVTDSAAATCTADGYITYGTSVTFDGKEHTSSKTFTTDAATGHSFGKWKETKPATPESDGEQIRVCSECGETETRAVPYKAETAYLLWLIIVLAVILAAAIVAVWTAITCTFIKKKEQPPTDGGTDGTNDDKETAQDLETEQSEPLEKAKEETADTQAQADETGSAEHGDGTVLS